MGILTEIVRNVLVIVLVAGFLEMLLPEGNTRPLVRLCIGMFVLIAVLNPILGFFFSGRDFEIGSWDYQPEQVEPVIDIQTEGARVHETLIGQSRAVTKEKLQDQINSVAVLVPGVQRVKSQIDIDENGQVQNVLLVVQTESETGGRDSEEDSEKHKDDDQTRGKLEEKISDLMRNLYGFEENVIKIKFEGG